MGNPVRARIPNNLSHIFQCKSCQLSIESHPVNPRGNWNSKVLGVGEGAGLYEEKKDCTFCGPAGEELDNTLALLGINLNKDLMCCNVVQCRPKASQKSGKQNRPPKIDEISACRPNLEELTKEFQPSIIVAIGSPAAKSLLNFNVRSMGQVAGKFFSKDKLTIEVDADLYCIWHPSYVLRNPNIKKDWVQQLMRLRDYMIMRRLFNR